MTAHAGFDIVYQDQVIKVTPDSHYRLTFPDGRWLLVGRHPDDTRTTSVENANISYSMAFVWVVEDASAGPNWLNHEQVQVIGELIKRKETELEEEAGA
jgi:hypothetical protein